VIPRLRPQQRDVAMRGQTDHLELAGVTANDVEHVPADGAGRAQDDDSFHEQNRL
jgi:hypothetical protein